MSVDPITVEIIRCALKAAANEMSAVLKKTAYNMMIYEVQDYCVAVLDHEGRTMSQNEGALPIFLADLGVAVQDGIEVYGKEDIHPGDVFLVNHPEICGQHLNNMAVYTPFFWEGKLVSFLAVRAHWIDVGGGSTGFGSSNTRDVYEEGLQVRSVKIYKRGQPNSGSAALDRRQYSLSRIIARRFARADRLLPHRRGTFATNLPQIRRRALSRGGASDLGADG